MQRIRLNSASDNCHNELVDYTMAFFECISGNIKNQNIRDGLDWKISYNTFKSETKKETYEIRQEIEQLNPKWD